MTLKGAQQKLADTQKRATARVDELAKQDAEVMRMKLAETRAKLMIRAGGQVVDQGSVRFGQTQLDNVSNESNTLAQTEGSSIIKKNTQDLGLDSADEQKIAEEYLEQPLLAKEALFKLRVCISRGVVAPYRENTL